MEAAEREKEREREREREREKEGYQETISEGANDREGDGDSRELKVSDMADEDSGERLNSEVTHNLQSQRPLNSLPSSSSKAGSLLLNLRSPFSTALLVMFAIY